jgi:tetratricopeptide (TPR) repeat protein
MLFKPSLSTLKSMCLLALLIMHIPTQADTFKAGIEAYEKADYASAQELLAAANAEDETAAARHNLALSYFQQGSPAAAVWHLERASRLEPFNKEYLYKLGALRQQLGLFDNQPKWHLITAQALSSNTWILTAAMSFWVFVAALILPIFSGARKHNGIQLIRIFGFAVLMISFSAIWVHSHELNNGIITSNEVASLHAAPAAAAPQSGSARPGERGRILDQHNEFYQIEIEAGTSGWVSKEVFRPLNFD